MSWYRYCFTVRDNQCFKGTQGDVVITGLGKKLVLKCDFSKFKELIANVGSFKVFLRENDFYENDNIIIAFDCLVTFVREEKVHEGNEKVNVTKLIVAELHNRELKVNEVEIFREVLRRQ